MPASPTHPISTSIPIPTPYRLVFLWLEPASILAGAAMAHAQPARYLALTFPASGEPAVPPATRIAMDQLANLYLGLAVLEASVLRATADLSVWRTFIAGLLLADLGHLYSVHPRGPAVYWDCRAWNAIDWGNVAFVYFLALVRLLMLLRVGFHRPKQA